MKYVGIKEVLKAVKDGEVTRVYIGANAENHVIDELIKTCEEKQIEMVQVETMAELGKMAGIEIGASAAAE